MLDRADIFQADHAQLHPDRPDCLDCGKLTDPCGNSGVAQDRRPRHVRRHFFEQVEPFRGDRVFEKGKTSGTATRPCHAGDQAGTDRIDDAREHDRDRTGRLLQCEHDGAGKGEDDVRCKRDQLGRIAARAFAVPASPSNIEVHSVTVGPAQFPYPVRKRDKASLSIRVALTHVHQHTDPPHPIRPLRSRDYRPRCGSAEKGDELASLHVIELHSVLMM